MIGVLHAKKIPKISPCMREQTIFSWVC
jgi:hypothetical protein